MYFTYDDITIYYEKYGDSKKSIIILPGWGNTRNTFNYMINFLKNYFTVYILDYPGFGNSPFPEKDLNLYNYTILIHEWIKNLNIKKPILIGHSFGGRIITLLTGYYNYDSYENIIYLNSAGIKPKTKFKTIIYKCLKKLRYILPKKIKNKYQSYLFKLFASVDYQEININMQNTFKNIVNLDLKPYLKNINAKVLIIWGSNDTSTPLKDAYIMNKLIKKAELIILKASHFTYLDYPILINKIIYEQLKDEIV